MEVYKRITHRWHQARRVYSFALHAQAATILEEQQVQFRAVYGTPRNWMVCSRPLSSIMLDNTIKIETKTFNFHGVSIDSH
jgi:hypothetical protein